MHISNDNKTLIAQALQALQHQSAEDAAALQVVVTAGGHEGLISKEAAQGAMDNHLSRERACEVLLNGLFAGDTLTLEIDPCGTCDQKVCVCDLDEDMTLEEVAEFQKL